jgi:outer membrane protein W
MRRPAVSTVMSVALVILLAAPVAAFADDGGRAGAPIHKLSLGLTWSGPTNSFRDDFGSYDVEDALGVALTYEYRVTTRLGLSARLGLTTHDVSFVPAGSGDPKRDVGDVDVQPLVVGLNFYLDSVDHLDFYLTLPAVGYASFGSFDVSIEIADDGDLIDRRATADPDGTFVYGAGIGLDMPFGDGRWYFTSSLRFLVLSSEVEIENETLDLEMDPLELHAGFAYRF